VNLKASFSLSSYFHFFLGLERLDFFIFELIQLSSCCPERLTRLQRNRVGVAMEAEFGSI